MVEPETGLTRRQPKRQRVGWTIAAALVFGLGLVVVFGQVWRADLHRVAPWPELAPGEPSDPIERLMPLEGPFVASRRQLARGDQVFAVWAVAQNARGFLENPGRPFHADPCHPAENAQALGHPILSHGLLALPAYLATRDPVATYNFLLVAVVLLGALAMFALVAEWTAVPAAGIVAGLLYAFQASQLGLVAYPFLYDTTWTVLALWLVRRFFEGGRWRDAIGAAICCALQIALSFYAFLAAAVLAVPLLVWLFARYGTRHLAPGPTLVALAIVAGTASLVFAPYLAMRAAAPETRDVIQLFAPWSGLLPGHYLGGLGALLALAALVLPRRRVLGGIEGDPRWALVAGAVLVALLVTGGNMWQRRLAEQAGEPLTLALPNLFDALGVLVPGLDIVRGPVMLASGVHLAVSLLAGLGAAGLIRIAASHTPARFAEAPAVALVIAAAIAVLLPDRLGLGPPVTLTTVPLRPSAETLAFFEELERRGDAGPLLELPIDLHSTAYLMNGAGMQSLLSAYHHRRTSGCYNAKHPPEMARIEALARRLPDDDALAEIRAMGFRTIVVHQPPGGPLVARLEAATGDHALRRIQSSPSMTAFAVLP